MLAGGAAARAGSAQRAVTANGGAGRTPAQLRDWLLNFWFAIGFRYYRHRLTIRDTPMSKIEAAAIGLVEVSGRVRAHAPAETAPISGAPCIHWHVKIDSHQDNKRQTVLDKRSSAPSFDIEDSTGPVVIWPWAAEVIVTDVSRWEGSAARELAHGLQAGLMQDILKRADGSHLVVTEQKIEIGRTLYVIGAKLIDAVKSYMTYEKELLQNVTALRTQAALG